MSNKKRPPLPIPVVRWIRSHARKNYWRVASWYDLDDLIQDGLLCGYKCLARYGAPTPEQPGRIKRVRLGEITEPHFMSLVQSAFYNHMGGLIRSKRQGPDDSTIKFLDMGIASEYHTETSVMERLVPPIDGDQELHMMLTEFPDYLRKAILLHYHTSPLRKTKRGREQTLAEQLRELIGFPADCDLEREIRAFFWESKVLA